MSNNSTRPPLHRLRFWVPSNEVQKTDYSRTRTSPDVVTSTRPVDLPVKEERSTQFSCILLSGIVVSSILLLVLLTGRVVASETNDSPTLNTPLPAVLPTSQDGVFWTGPGIQSFDAPTESCDHEYLVTNEQAMGSEASTTESINYTIWRTVSGPEEPSDFVQWLSLVWNGSVVSYAKVLSAAEGQLVVYVNQDFDAEDARQLYESHLSAMEMPEIETVAAGLGRLRHVHTGRSFVVEESTPTLFRAFDDGGTRADDSTVQYEKIAQVDEIGGIDLSVSAIVTTVPIEASERERFGATTESNETDGNETESYENGVGAMKTFRMSQHTTCRPRHGETLLMPDVGHTASMMVKHEFAFIDSTTATHESGLAGRTRHLQGSSIPTSPFMPNFLQWYSDRLVLEYTFDTVRIFGTRWKIRATAAMYYEDSSVGLNLNLNEQSTGMDISFSVLRTNPSAGGSLLTIVDEDLAGIPEITLFTVGPLSLTLQLGVKFVSKLGLGGGTNQAFLELESQVQVYAEVGISTPCVIFIKLKLGIRVTGRVLRLKHQFGLYSPAVDTDLVSALSAGTACMEVRYLRQPFSLVIAPYCKLCYWWRCRRCRSCLRGLMNSLSVYWYFGAWESRLIWTSCGDGTVLLNPPSPPPALKPPPPPTQECVGRSCDSDWLCINRYGPGWMCARDSINSVKQRCYNKAPRCDYNELQ